MTGITTQSAAADLMDHAHRAVRISLDEFVRVVQEAEAVLASVPNQSHVKWEHLLPGMVEAAPTYRLRAWLRQNLRTNGFRAGEGGWKSPSLGVWAVQGGTVLEAAKMLADNSALGWATQSQAEAHGLTADDVAAYRAWFDALITVGEEAAGLTWSSTKWNEARTTVADAGRSNTKILHGFLVRAFTNRRDETGIVESGRGKTVHIRPIPGYHASIANYIALNHSGGLDEMATGWADADQQWRYMGWAYNTVASEETERFTLGDSSTHLIVLATPDMVGRIDKYFDTVKTWRNAALSEAETEHATTVAWQKSGGLLAMDRYVKVSEVSTTIETQFAKGISSAVHAAYGGGRTEHVRLALEDLDEEAVAVVKAGAARRLLDALGGPITETEQALIDSAPPESERNLDIEDAALAAFTRKMGDGRSTLAKITYY